MSTILFVENREKTFLFALVARLLIARGHQVHWLVQNPAFSPRRAGRVHRIGWPTRADLAAGAADTTPLGILATDRGRQYFAAGTAHYPFYRRAVRRIVGAVAPDLVIGESSLIQELLAIEAAGEIGAVFLHPAMDRYPDHRLSLLLGETQVSVAGSGDTLAPGRRRDLAERIGSGRAMPFYMSTRPAASRHWQTLRWFATRARVLAGRLAGERYNTPSLARKLALAAQRRRNAARWDRIARLPEPEGRALLYAMQVQPEASIDVWGRPFIDQPALLRRMLAAAPADVAVAVKANPRPRYDLSDAMLDLLEREPRLVALPRTLPMVEAQARTIGCVTVCGTVGLEAVFGRGRCLSLRHPIVDALFPHHAAATPEEAVRRLLDDPAAGRGSVADGERLLDHVMRQSYPGLTSDPVSAPHCMEPDNVRALADAIEHGLARLQAERPAEAA